VLKGILLGAPQPVRVSTISAKPFFVKYPLFCQNFAINFYLFFLFANLDSLANIIEIKTILLSANIFNIFAIDLDDNFHITTFIEHYPSP
jgi:hypothetical protein